MKVVFVRSGCSEEFTAKDAPEALFKLREILDRTLHKEFYRPIGFYVPGGGFDILPLRFAEAAEAEAEAEHYFYSADVSLLFQKAGRVSGLSGVIGTVEVKSEG